MELVSFSSNYILNNLHMIPLCPFCLLDEENNRHVVVNCGEALLKNNTYWPLVSDFINILSHQSVAKKFLEDHSLLMLWMSFVSFFQGKIALSLMINQLMNKAQTFIVKHFHSE